MFDWFGRYFVAVREIYDEVNEREEQTPARGSSFAELRAVAIDSVILYFAPIPPLAKAIRWKILGI